MVILFAIWKHRSEIKMDIPQEKMLLTSQQGNAKQNHKELALHTLHHTRIQRIEKLVSSGTVMAGGNVKAGRRLWGARRLGRFLGQLTQQDSTLSSRCQLCRYVERGKHKCWTRSTSRDITRNSSMWKSDKSPPADEQISSQRWDIHMMWLSLIKSGSTFGPSLKRSA